MSQGWRVVLIDDHELARRGLRAMLETADWLSVVGEAPSCLESLDVLRATEPDVVLLDIRMPGIDGLACLDRIKALPRPIAVVIVTLYDDRRYVVEAIRRGAAGYLQKDATAAQVLETLAHVRGGHLAVAPDLLRDALVADDRRASGPPLGPPVYVLTPRELGVLGLVADGLTNKEIGGRLGIGEDTVKKHVQNIIWKLRAADRTQAAVLALRLGLIEPGDG